MVFAVRRNKIRRCLVVMGFAQQQHLTSLFLGLLLGILAVTLFDVPFFSEESSCGNGNVKSNSRSEFKDASRNSDDYEPIINLQSKPKLNPSNSHKFRNTNVIRPRYYSTELNIKEKILVIVLSTNYSSFKLYGKALNETLGNYVDKIIYFASDDVDRIKNEKIESLVFLKPSENLDNNHLIKNFKLSSVLNQAKVTLLALKYVLDHHLKTYQYFYFVKDSTYVSGSKLKEFIDGFSFSDNIYVGHSINSNEEDLHCHLESGIIISHSVLTKLANPETLDLCLSQLNLDLGLDLTDLKYNYGDSEAFGKCILKNTNIPCSSQAKNKHYLSLNISEIIPRMTAMRFWEYGAVSAFPVRNYKEHTRLTKYLAQRELKNVYEKISNLELKLRKTYEENKLEKMYSLWPVGVQKNFVPQNRFDVNQWIYFNRTHIILEDDFGVANKLEGVNRIDIEDVLESCQKIARKRSPNSELIEYVGGYKRFDPTRGMEYLLDFIFLEKGDLVSTRYQILRPLSKTEMLTVPYVTEHTRIVLALPVWIDNIDKAMQFLEEYVNVCLKKKDNSVLVLLLLHNQDSTMKDNDNEKDNDPFYNLKALANNYTERFHSSNGRIAWMSVYLRKNFNYVSDLPIFDLLIRKLTPDSLVLLCKTNMELRLEYLNRVRMNTIHGTQVFFPVPFVQYLPSLIGGYRNVKTKEPFDKNIIPFIEIRSGQGRFDQENFDHSSFYVFDYLTSRKALEKEIPVAKTMKDLQKSLYYKESLPGLKEMFLKARLVHVMRATEPDLRLYHENVDCHSEIDSILETDEEGLRLKQEQIEKCMRRNWRNTGTKSAIASILLGYQNNQNSSAKEDYSDTE